jgi:hypothetical protein
VRYCSEEVEGLATELGLKLFRASVKDNTNITEGLSLTARQRTRLLQAHCSDMLAPVSAFDCIADGWYQNKNKNQGVLETAGVTPVA